MLRLNKNIQIGTPVSIPRLSWQVAKIAGEYTVVAHESGVYRLRHNSYGTEISIDGIALEYLLGTKVPYEFGVTYRTEDGLYPEVGDEEFLTEDGGSDIGFWYLGLFKNLQHISFNPGYYERFFYIKYPDDWHW